LVGGQSSLDEIAQVGGGFALARLVAVSAIAAVSFAGSVVAAVRSAGSVVAAVRSAGSVVAAAWLGTSGIRATLCVRPRSDIEVCG